jgi:hypothetical protein
MTFHVSPFQAWEAIPFPVLPYRPISLGFTLRRIGSEFNILENYYHIREILSTLL